MQRTHVILKRLLGALALASSASAVQAVEPTRAELNQQVAALDQAFFAAFNQCHMDALAAMVAEDLEFFHDKAGLMRSRQAFLDSVRQNVCGKFRRELLPGTTSVYPLEGFGAIQMGDHKFCQYASGRCEGQGKFVHVWHQRDGRWELMRVLSYEHQALPQ